MIINESVKNAIVNKLIEVFPKYSIYKEEVSNPSYPNFFVYGVNMTDDEERKDIHLLTYDFDIRFRTNSDYTTERNLEYKLDDVSFILSENFNIITIDDSYVRCVNKRSEKVDCILHYFFTIKIMVKDVRNDEGVKMMQIINTIKIKGGN